MKNEVSPRKTKSKEGNPVRDGEVHVMVWCEWRGSAWMILGPDLVIVCLCVCLSLSLCQVLGIMWEVSKKRSKKEAKAK